MILFKHLIFMWSDELTCFSFDIVIGTSCAGMYLLCLYELSHGCIIPFSPPSKYPKAQIPDYNCAVQKFLPTCSWPCAADMYSRRKFIFFQVSSAEYMPYTFLAMFGGNEGMGMRFTLLPRSSSRAMAWRSQFSVGKWFYQVFGVKLYQWMDLVFWFPHPWRYKN